MTNSIDFVGLMLTLFTVPIDRISLVTELSSSGSRLSSALIMRDSFPVCCTLTLPSDLKAIDENPLTDRDSVLTMPDPRTPFPSRLTTQPVNRASKTAIKPCNDRILRCLMCPSIHLSMTTPITKLIRSTRSRAGINVLTAPESLKAYENTLMHSMI